MNSNDTEITRMQRVLSAGRIVRGLRAPGPLPTLLMLSPLGMTAAVWTPVLRAVDGKYAAVAVDFAGFGSSEIGKADPTYTEQRAMLNSYLDSLHGPLILMACSTAVPLCLELARREEHRVDALVVSGFGAFRSADGWLGRVQEVAASPEMFLRAMFDEQFACAATQRDVAANLLRPAFRSFYDKEAHAAMRIALADVNVPTLVFAGRKDALVSHEDVEKAVKSSSIASVEWVDAGHLAMLQRPAELMRAVSKMLESTGEHA